MRLHGIRALAGRRFKPCTTDSRHYLPVAPNLLKQEFVASAPNRVWLADITYIATGEGWLYLAAVLDLATRKIVGWSPSAGLSVWDGVITKCLSGVATPLRRRM